MTDRTERAAVGDLELAYETFGDADAPPLVLIMGLATQMLAWDDEFCGLVAGHGFHVIRFETATSDCPVTSTRPEFPTWVRCSVDRARLHRRTRWWTWPRTQQGCSTRSVSSPRTSSVRRWGA